MRLQVGIRAKVSWGMFYPLEPFDGHYVVQQVELIIQFTGLVLISTFRQREGGSLCARFSHATTLLT